LLPGLSSLQAVKIWEWSATTMEASSMNVEREEKWGCWGCKRWHLIGRLSTLWRHMQPAGSLRELWTLWSDEMYDDHWHANTQTDRVKWSLGKQMVSRLSSRAHSMSSESTIVPWHCISYHCNN
jgi:hypothetical protein